MDDEPSDGVPARPQQQGQCSRPGGGAQPVAGRVTQRGRDRCQCGFDPREEKHRKDKRTHDCHQPDIGIACRAPCGGQRNFAQRRRPEVNGLGLEWPLRVGATRPCAGGPTIAVGATLPSTVTSAKDRSLPPEEPVIRLSGNDAAYAAVRGSITPSTWKCRSAKAVTGKHMGAERPARQDCVRLANQLSRSPCRSSAGQNAAEVSFSVSYCFRRDGRRSRRKPRNRAVADAVRSCDGQRDL